MFRLAACAALRRGCTLAAAPSPLGRGLLSQPLPRPRRFTRGVGKAGSGLAEEEEVAAAPWSTSFILVKPTSSFVAALESTTFILAAPRSTSFLLTAPESTNLLLATAESTASLGAPESTASLGAPELKDFLKRELRDILKAIKTDEKNHNSFWYLFCSGFYGDTKKMPKRYQKEGMVVASKLVYFFAHSLAFACCTGLIVKGIIGEGPLAEGIAELNRILFGRANDGGASAGEGGPANDGGASAGEGGQGGTSTSTTAAVATGVEASVKSPQAPAGDEKAEPAERSSRTG